MFKLFRFTNVLFFVLMISQFAIAGRYYHAATGRFLEADPMADKYPSHTPYHYVLNNPLKYIDPTGMIVEFADEDTEKEIMTLINQKDKQGNYVNKDLRDQYTALHESEEIYKVSFGDSKGGKNAEGSFSYNGTNFEIMLKSDAKLSLTTRISHEFEHALQYERGEIGFVKLTNGAWTAFNYDITDETKAWDASLKVAKSTDYWYNGKRSQLSEYSRKETQASKESYLRRIGYAKRRSGPLNNTLSPPSSIPALSIRLKVGTILALKYKLYKGN